MSGAANSPEANASGSPLPGPWRTSPALLILDEATSALDPKNEAEICATLVELKKLHTIIAISHQPAILDVADQAYRIEDGRISPA